MTADDYLMRYEGYHLEAVDDHIAAVTELVLFDAASGAPLGEIVAEQRFHPNLVFRDLKGWQARVGGRQHSSGLGAAA